MHHSYLDKYATKDSFFHRLDSRVKFLAAIIYTALILSLPTNSPAIVFLYAIAPFGVLVWSGIPAGFVFRRIAAVSPFILILALSCPLYDNTPNLFSAGRMVFNLSEGWLRCFTIIVKFVSTMLTLFALTCTTRFADMLAGLQQMRFPDILVIQLSFIYRYLFVLIDQVGRMLRARSARKLTRLPFKMELKLSAAMIGTLFIKSIEKAQRIHIAMQARGFQGKFHALHPLHTHPKDYLFAGVFIVYCIILHGFLRFLL